MTVARVVPSSTIAPSADAFLNAEQGEQSSEPREYCEITHGTTTYRIAFGSRDLVVAGVIYTALPVVRSELSIAGAGKEAEMALTLPINHDLVKRYLQLGVPPVRISATFWRLQVLIGISEQIWTGDITSMAWDDECTEATFRIPARMSEALARVLPTVTAGRKCPHVLYDATCRIDRNGTNPDGVPYKCTATVLFLNGRDLRIDLSNVPTGNTFRSRWLVQGELKHLATGDSMTIVNQADLDPSASTVTKVTLQLPIVGMQIGDIVEVYAGCDWTNPTCKSKFNNLSRHGGCSFMPAKNPFVSGFKV